VAKFTSVLSAVIVIGLVGLLGWRWFDQWSSQRALAAHFESGKAYAARMLEEVAVLTDELRESSGVAVSRTQPGVLWSHNDSSDGPNLYAIDISGNLLATIKVTNAQARDWEDISSGPCPGGVATADSSQLRHCLYLADTGDNNEVRPQVTIYVVVEPRLGPAGALSSTIPAARSFSYRYPDKPHDAEALAVQQNGDVTIVSKGRSSTIDFFSIPAAIVKSAIASGETITAQYAGNTNIRPESRTGRLATAAAVSPDGMTLAVRTYYEVFFFGLTSEGGGSRWRDLGRPCSLGDAEPQGEAIDFLDADTLLLTSERARGRPGTIHRLQC
jgi:hypothetical protein